MKNILEKIKIYGIKTSLRYIFIDIKRKFWLQCIQGSYGQQGEDLIIDELLNYKKSGFYVDVGAYDPDRFSNTKRFYIRGWNGINIEPNTSNYNRFKVMRTRDINLNIGIGSENKKMTFYQFIPDTLSTFSQTEAEKYRKQGYSLVDKKKIETKTLSSVLDTYCKKQSIDFFSIDTEGFDMEVLKSNDWKKYKPSIICIESSNHTTEKSKNKNVSIKDFLTKNNYKEVFTNDTNSIYSILK